MTATVKYADVTVGTELPPVSYPATRLSLVKYCGASGDFNVIHWNERVARSVGLLCLVGYFSPFFDGTKRNQGWHDKAASCFVVNSR